ncbi:MAG TPA: tetratricopeptide repeat protein [Rectinemataceae bacterium]|nr:tetratricopeptide repeat protein [Rectinemataceae bacterium]
MPKVASYRANSVIYFQGDVSDKVFILQAGKVSLNYADIETGKETREIIQMGEFFGVKSALGKYPREENALVLSDTQVLVFTVPEFEVFAQANTRIIMKMLKVFSNQLRRVHKQVENLLEKSEAQSPEYGLFKAGEYYLKSRQYSQGKYVFSRYLTYYPAGKLAEQASRYLEMAEAGSVKYGDGRGPAPLVADASGRSGRAKAESADELVASVPPAQRAPGDTLSGAAKDYYDAVSLFSSERYKEALAGFKRIVEVNEDPEYTMKALYDMGRCLYMLQQYDLTIKHFTQLVQTYPKHPDLIDTLYWLGQSYERKGDATRAKGFYKKILSMESDEDASTRIKATRSLRQLEEGKHG